jgi:hypothetical protein
MWERGRMKGGDRARRYFAKRISRRLPGRGGHNAEEKRRGRGRKETEEECRAHMPS